MHCEMLNIFQLLICHLGTGKWKLLKKTRRRQHLQQGKVILSLMSCLSGCQMPQQHFRDSWIWFSGLHYEECLVYLDDVIVFSSSLDNHLNNLKAVFTRLVNADLKLKSTKYHLCCDEVHYLRHIVSRNGL